MARSGWALFLTIVLGVWALMHAYVFWRVAAVPWVTGHVTRRQLLIAAVVLWASYPLARMLNSCQYQVIGVPLEFLATTWIGFLFLALAALLVTDICTLGGLLLPRYGATLPGWAVMVAAILSLIALVQGLRPPVIRDYEIQLPGLPRERDGLTVVAISDMHLGTLLGERWMSRLIERVDELKPEVVFVVGDLVDGKVDQVQALAPVLRKLRAPLGVWCVTGNHEYYAGVERSVALMESAGYNVLRDRWAELAPGLIVAGVDDLTARRQFGVKDRPLDQALTNRPAGAVILLSHTPWDAERAAAAGVGLMLSGHTHNGQIWPFNYLVRLRYRFLSGQYQIRGMTLLVGRGSGTWGPRMRLWGPGEILRLKLRSAA
jgi:predicted MPP superfamily phosphohydrolase